jgi:hypothetical protein
MEFHGYDEHFGWTAPGCSVCCPVMRHKTGFLLAIPGQHGRKAAWRAYTAMEIHSYQGALDPLWNSTAMVRVHSYGIPQLWCAFTAMEFQSWCKRTMA